MNTLSAPLAHFVSSQGKIWLSRPALATNEQMAAIDEDLRKTEKRWNKTVSLACASVFSAGLWYALIETIAYVVHHVIT